MFKLALSDPKIKKKLLDFFIIEQQIYTKLTVYSHIHRFIATFILVSSRELQLFHRGFDEISWVIIALLKKSKLVAFCN